MATFRTSTLPDWSLYERDGYFASRNARVSETPVSSPPEKVGGVSATQLKCNLLSKDLKQAEFKLKLVRLAHSMWLACGWQIIVLFVFSLLFPDKSFSTSDHFLMKYLGVNYFYNVGATFASSVVSVSTLVLVLIVYAMLFISATCLTTQEKFAESLQEQFNRYLSVRFLMKPICFGLVAWAYCFFFLQVFDTSYADMFLVKETADEYKAKFFYENKLVIRVAAFISGVQFFVHNFVSGGFRIQFPSTRVKWTLSSLVSVNEGLPDVWGSIRTAVVVWLGCWIVGPMFYTTFFSTVGIHVVERLPLERMIMFLDMTFMLRLLLWVYLTRLTFRLYLKLVNTAFTEIINLPIESPPGNDRSLLLSEAMKGDNIYMKFQGFYEFKLKSHSGNPDVMVFFNITHPGNHPLNWKGVFTASCQVLSDMNDRIIKFLKTVKLPPTLLQGGFQPSVLNQLRQTRPSDPTPLVVQQNDNRRSAMMRDLTSIHEIEVPKWAPTVYDLVKQFPAALWNDLRDAGRGLLTMQNVNNLLFFGKLETKMPEKQIANVFSRSVLSFWAMEGTLELICISIERDSRGIVHQDLQCYMEKILNTYDTLSVLDFYIANSLDGEPTLNRSILEDNKATISKLIGATVFVLAKLHATFSHCYSILNVDEDSQRRVEEIVASRGSRF